MANISVTNVFSNSTTADASAVNTNFNDLVNGLKDGTKDLSISALSTAGVLTVNGGFGAAGYATAAVPGIVSTGTQTIAGAKTFTGAFTPSGGIVGKTDGAASSGNVSEIITASFSSKTITTSGTTLVSQNLNQGIYLALYYANVTKGASTRIFIGNDTSLSSGTLYMNGNDFAQDAVTTTASLGGTAYLLVTAVGSTFIFAARSAGSDTSGDGNGRITFLRIG
jgi:hypothetical protein